MAFSFRTFAQVFADAVAYVKANSRLTDFNVGSVVRTILEAISLEFAAIYVQLVRFKDFFNLELVSGDDLTERALEYNCRRKPPTVAQVKIALSDSGVATVNATTLASDHAALANALVVVNASAFPPNGYVILDRDGANRERVSYTGVSGSTLTGVSLTLRKHLAGVSVIQSQQGSDHVFPVGSKVIAKGAAADGSDVVFTLTEEATLLDGAIVSPEVTAVADTPGSTQKVVAGAVRDFASLPWATAEVTNAVASIGGDDQETDDKLRARCRATVQSASRGTPLAIERAALSTELATGTRCNSVQLLEPVVLGVPSTLFIHDGGSTNAFVTSTTTDKEVLLATPPAGQTRCRTANWPLVAGTLKLRKAITNATANKAGYGSSGFAPLLGKFDDLTKNWDVNMYAGDYLVDSNAAVFLIASNTANELTLTDSTALPAVGFYGIFNFAGAPLAEFTDYNTNKSTGEIELVVGLEANQMVVAYDAVLGHPAYQYYTGLIQEVQKVINGVRSDPDNYSGYRAGGSQIVVSAPVLDTVNLTISVTPLEDVAETVAMHTAVSEAVEDYLNSLSIGEDFIHAEAIKRCQAVDGIKDTQIVITGSSNSDNIETPSGHILRPGTITVQ